MVIVGSVVIWVKLHDSGIGFPSGTETKQNFSTGTRTFPHWPTSCLYTHELFPSQVYVFVTEVSLVHVEFGVRVQSNPVESDFPMPVENEACRKSEKIPTELLAFPGLFEFEMFC